MAYYKLVKTPNPKKDDSPMPYHARFVNQTTSRMDKILKMATGFSTFSQSDIIGVLEILKQVIALELSNGCNVELEGFGTFTVSLKCPLLYDKKEIQTEDVEFKTVKMRVAADLKKRVKHQMKLSKQPDLALARFTPEQRKQRLIRHIHENEYITARDYRQKTNICKSQAAKELKSYIEQGIIVKKGAGSGTFYMFPKIVK